MAGRYAVSGSRTAGAAKTILGVTGSASVRVKVNYIQIGSSSAPADNANNLDFKVATAAGTVTAVTPNPLDQADIAASATAGENHSAEPTYSGAALLEIGMHQRAIYQWYANEGGEFISLAAAGDGFGLQIVSLSAGTPTIHSTFHFQE